MNDINFICTLEEAKTLTEEELKGIEMILYNGSIYKVLKCMNKKVNEEAIGHYYINKSGDIISSYSSCREKFSHLKLRNADGWLNVTLLGSDKIGYNISDHQCVICTWLGFPPEDMEDPTVDHINGIRNDNRIENLRWLPRKENSKLKNCRNRIYTDEDIGCMVVMYVQDNKSLSEIASYLNSTTEIVRKYLQNCGVHIRTIRESTGGCTDEEIDEIVDKYNSGNKMMSLSEEYGVDRGTIRKYLIDNEVPIRSASEELKVYDEKEIIRLYTEEKIGSTKIAEMFGTYDTTILDILKRNKIPIRSVSESRKLSTTNKLSDEVISDICEDFKGGATLRELSRKYNVQPQTIKRYLIKNDVYVVRSSAELTLKQYGVTPELEERICNRYLELHNAYEVAKEFGVGKRTVYSCLHRNNIAVQNKSEAAKESWSTKRENNVKIIRRSDEEEAEKHMINTYGKDFCDKFKIYNKFNNTIAILPSMFIDQFIISMIIQNMNSELYGYTPYNCNQTKEFQNPIGVGKTPFDI